MAINNGLFYSQKEGLKLSTNNLNRIIVSTGGTTTVSGTNNNSVVLNVKGTQGELVTITDNINGSLFTVIDSYSGSIFTVNSNNSIVGGTPSGNTFVVSGTSVGIGNILSPTNKLHVSASTDPVRFVGLQNSTDSKLLTTDNSGVIHTIFMSAITASGVSTATTIYNGNGTLLSDRILQMSSNTLTFSSSTNLNSFIFKSTGFGINTSPSYALDVVTGVEFDPVRIRDFYQIDSTLIPENNIVTWNKSNGILKTINTSALTEVTLVNTITNNTPVTALTVTITTGEVGQLDVAWYGIVGGGDYYVTGRGITSYFKNSSNVMSTTYVDLLPPVYNALFNGTEIDVSAVNGNMIIKITSLSGYDVQWRLDVKRRGIDRLGSIS